MDVSPIHYTEHYHKPTASSSETQLNPTLTATSASTSHPLSYGDSKYLCYFHTWGSYSTAPSLGPLFLFFSLYFFPSPSCMSSSPLYRPLNSLPHLLSLLSPLSPLSCPLAMKLKSGLLCLRTHAVTQWASTPPLLVLQVLHFMFLPPNLAPFYFNCTDAGGFPCESECKMYSL